MAVKPPEYHILQAVRDWTIDALDFTTDAHKRRVIIEQKGQFYGNDEFSPDGESRSTPRPDPPFLVITLLTHGRPLGTDSHWVDSNGNNHYEGTRGGSVEIQGFGRPTNGWLSVLGMKYRHNDTVVSLVPRPGIQDLSALVDGDYIEARYAKEFEIYYTIAATPADHPTTVTQKVEVDIDTFDGLTGDIDVNM